MPFSRTFAWRPRAAALSLMLAALLGGCASFSGAPTVDPATTLATADPLYASYVTRFYATTDMAQRVAVRNEFIEQRSGVIDRAYAGFKESIYTQRVGSAVGVDIATLVLNAAGAALPDAGVKTGTSALSATLIGSKTSIDKNVYFDRTLPALLAQMDGQRSVVRERILAGMASDATLYPLMQAASDLDAYLQAGSVTGAIAAITAQAGAAQQTAEKALRSRLPSERDLTLKFTRDGFTVDRLAATDAAKVFQACVDSKGVLRDDVKTEIARFLVARGAHPLKGLELSIADFVQQPGREPQRAEALADPVLGPLARACTAR